MIGSTQRPWGCRGLLRVSMENPIMTYSIPSLDGLDTPLVSLCTFLKKWGLFWTGFPEKMI